MDVQYQLNKRAFSKARSALPLERFLLQKKVSHLWNQQKDSKNRIYTNPGPKGQIGSPIDGRAAHITNVYRVPPGMRQKILQKS